MAIITGIIIGGISAGIAAAAHDARTRIQGWVEGKPFTWHDILDSHENVAKAGAIGAASGGIGSWLAPAAASVSSNVAATGGASGAEGAAPGTIGATGTAVSEGGAVAPSGAAGAQVGDAATGDIARQAAEGASGWHAPMALPESPMPPGPAVVGPGSSPLQFATHVAEIARPAPSVASQVIGGLGRSLAQGAVRSLPSLIHGDWKNAGAGIAGGLVNQGIGAFGNAVTSNLSGAPAPRFQIDVGGATGMTGLDQQNMMIDRGPQFSPFRSAVDRVLGENPITTPSNPEPTNPYLMALTQGTSAMPTQILGNQAGSAVTRALSPPPTPPIAPLYGQPYYASLRRRIV